MAEDTTLLLQEISNHLADLKGHMAVQQSSKTKPNYVDETISIGVNNPWTLDYKGYHYVYVFSASGFVLQAEDLGTVSVSANSWTPVNLQQGQRLSVSSGSYTFLVRATDDLYSLGSSGGGGGGGGNSTIIAPLGTQVAANSVAVTLASNSSPFSTQRVASTTTVTAGALNAQLVNAVDLSEYGFWSLQIAETAFVGTLTFYGSNDGLNWIGITATNLNTSGTATSFTVSSGTPNSAFGGAAIFRFLQVTMTAYTSGTATGILTLFGGDSLLSGSSGGGGNVTVVGPLGSQVASNSVSVALASDQLPLKTEGGATEQASLSAGSLNADLVPSTDVSNYKWLSIQITGTFTGTLTFQASNDNTNFVSFYLYNSATSATAYTAATATGVWFGPVHYRYLRIRMTAYTSGTANGTLELYTSQSFVPYVQGAFSVAGTVTANPAAAITGGSTASHAISAASTNATSVKASAGTVYGISISNTNAAARYFKIYNKASSPTVGTDTPVLTIQVPATATVIRAFPVGLALSTGIAYAATGAMGDSDTTAIGAGDLSMDIDYK